MDHDWLVVGAGFTGATLAERLASQLDQRVLVVDRRSHMAGNAFDGPGPDGRPIHHYGAHIFHTVSDRVWAYLSQFTRWRPYEHRVLGSIDGKLVPIPFNLTSLHALVPERRATAIEHRLLAEIGSGGTIPVLTLLEHPDPLLRGLGDFVYEKVFSNYSAKQWGLRPDQLDRSVTGRVPVVVSHDDRYFHDRHQAMPADGYVAMFERMLKHPNIDVLLDTDHRDVLGRVGQARTVFTGPIDEYFGNRYGALPYRSLDFRHEAAAVEFAQPVAVVNHPEAEGFTRILEHKHLTGVTSATTVLTTEWPQDHVPGVNDPYYPVPRPENRSLHARYLELARDTDPEVVFAGRLADYKYYNMDQAVSRALLVFRGLVPGTLRRRPHMSETSM
ncbi:MAG TPA: UDP-galactopyranose mutase [Acidimicrobiales bacterium]|nr:UDP-galactopyranose mutase [Acidimicrobiales bacterium]